MKCQKIDTDCKYCRMHDLEQHCGLSIREKRTEDKYVVENRIRLMKTCPKKKK